MNNQIRVLRLLEYTGSSEDIATHLSQRGVKEVSPKGWDGGKVVIKESFITNGLGGWDPLPAETKDSDSFARAMSHLKAIDRRFRMSSEWINYVVDRVRSTTPTNPED